ncbi:MAG: hypothetical protein NTV01_00360 [Bacteroidia bacterium]|nr:hypothetical protein [Bacteroidia bacterium]
MERSNLSSMMFVSLAFDEMLNVRGGDGGTTPPPPPVKTGTEEDIIL